MPPKGKRLTEKEIAILKRWIDDGAHWPESQEHWSYQPPQRRKEGFDSRSRSDQDSQIDRLRNPIDRYVVEQLRKEGLDLSPGASPEMLVRRMSLDLTGLPPSPEESVSFNNAWHASNDKDYRQELVVRLADRLLASPQFGVRWARPWLDLARYADSHGFQRDDLRDIWPYRDWVIRSLNQDKPYDEFSIEQIAGDLIPQATEEQIIATGFNRCTTCNVEAGTEPEENRVNQVMDRVNTIGAIWLGTTLECAQCHDHKYDPVTTREYYQLFAFFNSTALEAERSKKDVPGSIKFLGPYRELSNPEKREERARIEAKRSRIEQAIAMREKELANEQPHWEEALQVKKQSIPQENLLAIDTFESTNGSAHRVLADGSILLSDDNPPATDIYSVSGVSKLTDVRGVKIETLTDPSLPGDGPGRGDADRPNFVLNSLNGTYQELVPNSELVSIPFQRAKASFSQKNFDVSHLLRPNTNKRLQGWAINPEFHKPHWALLEWDKPLGSTTGARWKFELVQEYGGARTIGRLRIHLVTGESPGEALPEEIRNALLVNPAKRTPKQAKQIANYRRSKDDVLAKHLKDREDLDARLVKLKGPKTLVMEELSETRPTYLLARGDYRSPRELLTPQYPTFMRRMLDADESGSIESNPKQRTRLDLARWLLSDQNPLAARVAVNRWWSELFGRGLVATPEDFGVQGDYPTHPELLDWLSVELMEKGWSMKGVLRTIVTSETYRQSSRLNPILLEKDPVNRLLSRGPRFRLDAELVRDNALSMAGLLSLQQGGAPIRPPQPEGLWDKVGGEKYEYEVSPGESKYRRGTYVVLKRSSPYPSMLNFDATARMTCTVKRSRSNTPLQALTLLNDPVFVEAASGLADRIVRESPSRAWEDRLGYAFQLVLARKPVAAEQRLMQRLWEAESRSNDDSKAWLLIATTLLNLDETITKP